MPSRLELIKLCPRYITTYVKKGRIKKNTNPLYLIFFLFNIKLSNLIHNFLYIYKKMSSYTI